MKTTQHRLSDIDPAARRAHCLACGPLTRVTPTGRRASGWQCAEKRAQERGAHKRLSRHGGTAFDAVWRRERFDELLVEQGGVCALCGGTNPSLRLSFDHDHSCCKHGCWRCVRGLLCVKCNTGIGKLGDSVEGLRKAIAYLERYER